MGQKVHPIGFRLGVIKKHNALWYAKGKAFKTNLIEDLKVRNYIKKKLRFSSISKVDLERSAQNLFQSFNWLKLKIPISIFSGSFSFLKYISICE